MTDQYFFLGGPLDGGFHGADKSDGYRIVMLGTVPIFAHCTIPTEHVAAVLIDGYVPGCVYCHELFGDELNVTITGLDQCEDTHGRN